MASDLITLVIRTTCTDADEATVDADVGTPTGIYEGDDASAASKWVKSPDNDSFLSSLVLDDVRDGGNLGSSAPLPWADGAVTPALPPRRARSSARRLLDTAPVACDIAVLAANPSSGSVDSSSEDDEGPTEGGGAEGRDLDTDAAASTANLASLSLGKCGTTNVMTLTVPHGKHVLDGWNRGHLEENYSIHVRRCWVGADPTERPKTHFVLPVASVHTAWEPPSDLASSLLARVSVHLDASAIAPDPPFALASARDGLATSDAGGGLHKFTTPSGASFLRTCSEDATTDLLPPGAPKVHPFRPERTGELGSPVNTRPTSRPRKGARAPEFGGWRTPLGTQEHHDASFSGPSLPSGRARMESEEALTYAGGGLATAPSAASCLSTCAQDAEAALIPPGAPKVRPSLPGRTSARRGAGDSGPTLRPHRPEVGGWGPPPGTQGGHDESFSGPSLPSGRARIETEEAMKAWLERERHETHQLLMIHVLLWTAMVVYLVWDCWRRKARKERWLQQYLHEQQQQQQRHSARDRAPVGAGGAAVQGASHGGHPAHDRGWGDDPGAMTPNAATQSDEPTSSHGADHVATPAVPITTAARPAQVSLDAFDDALPTEGPESLSPVSELKARHRLRIQAKRDLKAALLASPSAPHLTPVPHRLRAAALEVTPVRTKESSGDALESADAVGAAERRSPARLTPLPSWTPTRSESNECPSIPVRGVAATSETAPAGASCLLDAGTASSQRDVEPDHVGFRPTDDFSDNEGEGLTADRGGSTVNASLENQCPEGMGTRPAESITALPKRAVRPLRPIRHHNDPSPRNRESSVLDAFWNLGE